MPRHNRILVFEDDAPTADLLGRALEEANYHVIIVERVEDALRRCHEHAIDVAFVGLGGDASLGWETVQRLTESRPRLRFIVAGTAAERFNHPLAATAEALFEKPIDLDLLLETLNELSAVSSGLSDKRSPWSPILPREAAQAARQANLTR